MPLLSVSHDRGSGFPLGVEGSLCALRFKAVGLRFRILNLESEADWSNGLAPSIHIVLTSAMFLIRKLERVPPMVCFPSPPDPTPETVTEEPWSLKPP